MAVSEKGYAATAVADVLAVAGVSRETFYQHFSGKEDCFLAVLDFCNEFLHALIVKELAEHVDAPPADRLEHALAVYLGTLTEQASLATVFFLEATAAGEAAKHKRFHAQEHFIKTLSSAFGDLPGVNSHPNPDFSVRMMAAAIAYLVSSYLGTGRAAELPALRAPIMEYLRHTGFID